ncbi:MAG: HD domain-containing protein [Elusimicrobiota bacterium]
MIKKILKALSEISSGHKVYIVGGWLRDKLLKKENRDLDLAVSGDARKFAKTLSGKLKGRLVVLDEKNKVFRIILKHNTDLDYIDVSAMKGPSIEKDLGRRDFSVNSIAAAIENPAGMIDPRGGIKDIKKKIVRMTDKKCFSDDPLRMLRAFRIASELKFKIEPSTLRRIRKDAPLIRKSAGERIREELCRIFADTGSSGWIAQIDKSGLLEKLLPEISVMKQSARSFYFHPNGLWQHSIETLASLEEIFRNLSGLFHENSGRIREYLNEPVSRASTRGTLLKLVALLHDIAKPACAKRAGNRMRFIGHDKKGAEMIARAFERLKMSRKETRAAQNIVSHHMRPISLGQANVLTSRASVRLFKATADNLPMLLLLSLADCYSYRRLKVKKAVELKKMRQVVRDLFSRYFAEKERSSRPRIIDGHMIMKKFKLKPGPVIGKLLNAVSEAQMMGKISTSEEALALARKTLTRYKK